MADFYDAREEERYTGEKEEIQRREDAKKSVPKPKEDVRPYHERDHKFTPWQGDPNICGLCALSINLHQDRPKPEVRTDTLFDRLLPIANKTYKELKMQKHPYKAPEFFPDLGDTGKAILKTLCDHLESKKDPHGFIRG